MDLPKTSAIVEATKRDIHLLARLIRAGFTDVAQRFALTPENCPKHPSNCTSAWIEKDLERGVHYFQLTIDGDAVGCVGVEKAAAATCYMERLAVLPTYRGRGFGTILARHALGRAAALGVSTVGIGIIAADTGLKDFYKALGFEEGETKTFPHLPFEVAFMKVVL